MGRDADRRAVDRALDLRDELARLGPDPGAAFPCLLARTKGLGAYPTVARRYYACEPLNVMGDEVEGASASTTVVATTFCALNVGGAVPPAGTEVILEWVGTRWVFQHD